MPQYTSIPLHILSFEDIFSIEMVKKTSAQGMQADKVNLYGKKYVSKNAPISQCLEETMVSEPSMHLGLAKLEAYPKTILNSL